MISASDPDHRAIIRRRRQHGRCVACGVYAHGRVFCDEHVKEHSYCPTCESILPRVSRTSYVCADCQRAAHQPMDDYRAACQQHRHPHLDAVIRLYRKGLRRDDIAAELHIHPKAVTGIIDRARAKGQWPAKLRRHRPHRTTKHANDDIH